MNLAKCNMPLSRHKSRIPATDHLLWADDPHELGRCPASKGNLEAHDPLDLKANPWPLHFHSSANNDPESGELARASFRCYKVSVSLLPTIQWSVIGGSYCFLFKIFFSGLESHLGQSTQHLQEVYEHFKVIPLLKIKNTVSSSIS